MWYVLKRFLALLAVLLMSVSLLPAGYADPLPDEETRFSQLYDFLVSVLPRNGTKTNKTYLGESYRILYDNDRLKSDMRGDFALAMGDFNSTYAADLTRAGNNMELVLRWATYLFTPYRELDDFSNHPLGPGHADSLNHPGCYDTDSSFYVTGVDSSGQEMSIQTLIVWTSDGKAVYRDQLAVFFQISGGDLCTRYLDNAKVCFVNVGNQQNVLRFCKLLESWGVRPGYTVSTWMAAQPELPEPTAEPEFTGMQVLIRDSMNVYLRATPDMAADSIGLAQAGTLYPCLQVLDGGWYQIMIEDGTTGYVPSTMSTLIQ